MDDIIVLIDDTKKIMNEIQERENTIKEIKDGIIYKKIKKYNNIFNPSTPINTIDTIYKQSSMISRSFNTGLFNLNEFSVENIEEEAKPDNEYSKLTMDFTTIKDITNKYANLDFLKYESLFNSLTFSNQIISLSSNKHINELLTSDIIPILKNNYSTFESKLVPNKEKLLEDYEKNIKSITWSWGKNQVREAVEKQLYISDFQNKLTDNINTTFADNKIFMTKLITYTIALLLKGATINKKPIRETPVLNDTSDISTSSPIHIYSIGDKIKVQARTDKNVLCNIFLDNISAINIDGRPLFYYSTAKKELTIHPDTDTSLFNNFISKSKYGDIFTLNYNDDLFTDKYSQILDKNNEEDIKNEQIIQLLTTDDFSDQINAINLVLNIGKIYNKKAEITEMHRQITSMSGGDMTYIKNNLLFDKRQMLKYVENLGQLSVLNEIIKQNDKILDKINLYKEYIKYFKSIIDIIDTEPFNNLSLLNKVLINYSNYHTKDDKSADKIYSKLDKGKDFVILLSLNDTYVSILNK
jgi:hypothetical protein